MSALGGMESWISKPAHSHARLTAHIIIMKAWPRRLCAEAMLGNTFA